MSTLKKQKKKILSFLEKNTIRMSNDEFKKTNKLFVADVSRASDLNQLVDYFNASHTFKHPEIAKHQRIGAYAGA